MMSKTSLVNKKSAVNLFLLTLRKNLGLMILVTIGILLLGPGYFLTSFHEANTYGASVSVKSLIITAEGIMSFIGVCAVALFNLINFSYLYTKRAGDVFHALPLTRRGLLLSRAASGMVCSVAPALLGYISLFAITQHPEIGGDGKQILEALLYTVVIMLFASAMSLLFIVCSGTAVDLLILFAGVNIGMLVSAITIIEICNAYLFGFYDQDGIIIAFSPIYYCTSQFAAFLSKSEITADGIRFLVVFFLEAAAMYTVSVLLYNCRRAERAGSAHAFRFVYYLCGVIISFVGAFCIGSMFSSGSFSAAYWIFASIGALLSAVIYGVITDRGFKTVKTSLVVGAVSFGIMLLVVSIAKTGAFGYSSFVPKAQKVTSVTISTGGEDYTFKNPEKAIALQKAIVKEEKKNTQERYIYFNYEYGSKNIERAYSIPYSCANEELLALYRDGEYIEHSVNLIKNRYRYSTVGISSYGKYYDDMYGYIDTTLTEEETLELLELYKEDVKTATMKSIERDEEDGMYLSIEWQPSPNRYSSFGIYIEPHFEKTVAFIDELKLLSRWENREN